VIVVDLINGRRVVLPCRFAC